MIQKYAAMQHFNLLACLFNLAAAIPRPLTLQATTLIGNGFGNSLPNTTLASIIPHDFTIRAGLPLDEPPLNQRNSLLLTLRALGDLALEDFNGEQQSRTWRSPQHVAIDIVGPAKTDESVLPVRKYALWGMYSAIHMMVSSSNFHPRIYELFWQRTLVGYVSFNSGARGVLGVSGASANTTNTALQKKNFSISPITLLPNTTTAIPQNNGVTISFDLTGRTIGEANVLMTLFAGILKAAPQDQTERVDEFVVNERAFNAYLSFMGRGSTKPDEPFLEYTHLIQLFTQLPSWMIGHGEKWTEAGLLVWVDDRAVGAGVLMWQVGNAVGGEDERDVVSS